MKKIGSLPLEKVVVFLLLVLFLIAIFAFILFLRGDITELLERLGGLFG